MKPRFDARTQHEMRALKDFFNRHLAPPTLLWPELVVPTYRAGKFGDWVLEERDLGTGRLAIRGFFSAYLKPAAKHWVLTHQGKTWMSITPHELESQQHHVSYLSGEVVIAGLGMGVVAYNAALKPNVRHVTVIERSRDVIDLFGLFSRDWPRNVCEKITIAYDDAERWRPCQGCYHCGYQAQSHVDSLYADIWLSFGDKQALAQMKTMCANMKPLSVSWWGQEMDFIAWAQQHIAEVNAYDLNAAHWRGFAQWAGLPLILQDCEPYPQLAVRALANSIMFPPDLPGPSVRILRRDG